MKVDPYLIDTLMRDLVAHSRSPRRFLCIYSSTPNPRGRPGVGGDQSHSARRLIGISKRSVQIAVAHLAAVA